MQLKLVCEYRIPAILHPSFKLFDFLLGKLDLLNHLIRGLLLFLAHDVCRSVDFV